MNDLISRTVNSPVGRNVFFLGISGAAKAFSSIAFVLLAVRTLEPGESGEVILAFLLVRVAQNVAGVGLSRYLARESANDPGATNALTLDVIKLFGLLLPLGLLVSGIVAPLDFRICLAIALLALAAVFGGTHQAIGGTFLGRDRTYLDSAVEVLGAVSLLVGTLIVALLNSGPLAYFAVLAVSRGLACALALALFFAIFRPTGTLLSSSASTALTRGVPYMLNAGASFVFLRADILLLGVLSGTRAVSIYGGVADPLVTLTATVHILNTAFLPGLSSDASQRPRLAVRMLALDLALGGLLALIVMGASGPLAERFLGEGHQASVDVLRVLSVLLALRFVNNGLATWITASGRQWRRTLIATSAGVFNICANLVAIPIWGYWAAVYTTLITEALILGLSMLALRGEWSLEMFRRTRPSVGEGYPVAQD